MQVGLCKRNTRKASVLRQECVSTPQQQRQRSSSIHGTSQHIYTCSITIYVVLDCSVALRGYVGPGGEGGGRGGGERKNKKG